MNLEHIPLFDHHAHAPFQERFWREAPLEPYFSEGYDPALLEQHVPHTLFFRRSMRDLAEFYGCEPTPHALLEARAHWDYLELNRKMFKDANILDLLLDDGIWPDRLWSVLEAQDKLPLRVERILRLETELATLLPLAQTVGDLLERLEAHLRNEAPRLAGLKSILAYRTGLALETHSQADLERAFIEAQHKREAGITRLEQKALLDTALWRSLEVAAELGLPVQFHIGYGDPDLDLRLANPLHLRPAFEAPHLKGLKVVLLHCYPFVREAGYLAGVYPGAYLDLGLTIPYTSVSGMRTAALEALHLSPLSKVLLSTDAQRTPELFWLAARWGRRILGQVLEQTVQDGDLTSSEAEEAAVRILNGNARAIYPHGGRG